MKQQYTQMLCAHSGWCAYRVVDTQFSLEKDHGGNWGRGLVDCRSRGYNRKYGKTPVIIRLQHPPTSYTALLFSVGAKATVHAPFPDLEHDILLRRESCLHHVCRYDCPARLLRIFLLEEHALALPSIVPLHVGNGLVGVVSLAVGEEVVDEHSDDGEEEDNKSPKDLVGDGAVGLEDLNYSTNASAYSFYNIPWPMQTSI
jgi:hypothetical protein